MPDDLHEAEEGGQRLTLKVVIIGAGAAGLSALEAVRSVDSRADIAIVSKEDVPPYSLVALPYILSNEIEDKNLRRFDEDYFKRMNAGVVTGRVTQIDVGGKRVAVEGRGELSYDKLLIASGSIPLVPRITGLDKKGVHFMGSLSDTWKLRDAATEARPIVVIGAGFVGLEAAIALRKLGKEVTVVEMLERVLPRMLDPDIAGIVQKMLEEKGVRVILGSQVTEVLGAERVAGVRLSSEEIACDLVVVGIGVRPNIEFLKGTPVKTNAGILVDDAMRTNVPDVYAAGDVVEAFDPLMGKARTGAIWPNAMEQGKVAGLNMAGKKARYSGLDSVNIINIFDVPVVALGLTSLDAENAESIATRREKNARKLIIKDDKAVGLQSIGSVRNLGFVLTLIKKGQKLGDLREKILDDRFAYPVATR